MFTGAGPLQPVHYWRNFELLWSAQQDDITEDHGEDRLLGQVPPSAS